MLMHEPAGEPRLLGIGPDPKMAYTRFNETKKVYSRILRMIVVRTRHGYCLCVPISTYQGWGLTKPGVNADDHAIAFASGKGPVSLDGEKPTRFEPIEVKLAPGQTLHEMSRINFAKVYTVEWNVKARDVGMVAPKSLPYLLTAWNTSMGYTWETAAQSNIAGPSARDDLFQRVLDKKPPDPALDTGIPEPKAEGSYHSTEDDSASTSTPDVLRTLSSELNRSPKLNPHTRVNIYSSQTQPEASDSGLGTSIADDEEHGLPGGVMSYKKQSVRDWFLRDESEVVYRLATIQDQILPELESLESGLVSINVQVEWEIMAFLRKNFRSFPRIGLVLVLVGKVTACEALTTEECLSRRYGTIGIGLLNLLQEAIEVVRTESPTKDEWLCSKSKCVSVQKS